MSTIPVMLEASPKAEPVRSPSPVRLILSLSALIFLAEIVSMIVIYFIPLPNYLATTLLDGMIMTALIFPGLYIFQLKPIMNQNERRAQVEQALRANEDLLRRTLKLMPVGVWITDHCGKIIHGNQASKELWGDARYVDMAHYGEYKGWWPNTGKPVAAEEWAGARAIMHGETTLEEELEIENFDGIRKIILNSAVPIKEEEKIIGAVIVNQDITDRRLYEKKLSNTNQLLEKFFLSINTLIAYLDRDFNFIRVNEMYASYGGHPPAYFIGKNHFDLYPHPENQAIFQRVVETGETYSILEKPFEYEDFPERGVTYWDWSLQPVKGRDGEVVGLVFSLVDVTKRKLAELLLEKQNQELRELSQAEHRLRELAEGLVQATMTLNSSLDSDQVLLSILEQTKKAIPCHGASIHLLEKDSLRLAGSIGFEGFPECIDALQLLKKWDDLPTSVSIRTDPIQVRVGDHLIPPGLEWVRSYLSVHLVVRNNITGILNLYSDQSEAFTGEDANRLSAFSVHASNAIHNAQAYQAQRDARKYSETMYSIANALNHKLDLKHVMNTLLDSLALIIEADIGGVCLFEDETDDFIRETRGFRRWKGVSNISGIRLDGITDSLIKKLVTSHRTLYIPQTRRKTINLGSEGEVGGSWLLIPIIAGEKVTGFVELGSSQDRYYSDEQTQLAETLVSQAAVAIKNASLYEQVRSSSEQLFSLTCKLVEVQENERKYVARELHDEVGQILSFLQLQLDRLRQDPECPPHIGKCLIELKSKTDSVMEDLHRLAMDLRPVVLDHLGLVPALEQLIGTLRSENLEVQFKAMGFEDIRLSPAHETNLYRIVQEALTNAVRYAEAENLSVLLDRSKGMVKVFIDDDGKGFISKSIKGGRYLGLLGMKERAEMMGGQLEIESSPGLGTSIIVKVPECGSTIESEHFL